MNDVRIIDFPPVIITAPAVVLADGHSEIHKWHGTRIRPPVTGQVMQLNDPAGDSKNDISGSRNMTTVAT